MTEINWPSTFGYTVFCDDVRHEMFGKISLIGIYQGEMKVVGVLPISIPKFALAIHYFETAGESDAPLELRVFLPGDLDDAPTHRFAMAFPPRAEVEKPPDGDDVRVGIHFFMQMAPLVISQAGRIKVRMMRGDNIIRLGSLRVTPVSTADFATAN